MTVINLPVSKINRARIGREVEVLTGDLDVSPGNVLVRSGYKALVISTNGSTATVVDLYFPWED